MSICRNIREFTGGENMDKLILLNGLLNDLTDKINTYRKQKYKYETAFSLGEESWKIQVLPITPIKNEIILMRSLLNELSHEL